MNLFFGSWFEFDVSQNVIMILAIMVVAICYLMWRNR